MDTRSIVFLEVMAGIAVIGVLAFLVFLVTRYAARPAGGDGAPRPDRVGPAWYGFLLAGIVLVIIALVLVWQFLPFDGAAATPDWRDEPRALVFFIVMLALAVLGLAAFLIVVISQNLRGPRAALPPREIAAGAAAEPVETPSAARLLGLLGLGIAILLLNWTYLAPEGEYGLMVGLIYPAALAVALVLLFDKASRRWSTKGAAESVREWLLCDAAVFLLVLGYLNLRQSAAGADYTAMFWDLLHIVAFFFIFWLVDRKVTRYRFLVAYAYLIGLPILLLIWRATQGVAATEGLGWWSSIWPFFILAIIFFALEVIALIAAREQQRHTVPAVKDAVFVAAYAILLLIAIPEAAA